MVVSVSFATMSKANGSCTLSQVGAVDVSWTAYKTPAKLGVGGTFNQVTFKAAAPSGTNFKQIFVGATLLIQTDSVNSNNSARDAKLVQFFFDKMVSKTIEGKIIGYTAGAREKGKPKTGVFTVAITMNKVTKNIPMNFSYFEGVLEVSGVIDVFDFKAQEALNAINKACFELHKGKTWSDVSIGFKTQIKAVCNPK